MKPRELAAELGLSQVPINNILQQVFPRDVQERHQPWDLSDAQAQAVRDYVARRRGPQALREVTVASVIPTPSGSPTAAHDEWF